MFTTIIKWHLFVGFTCGWDVQNVAWHYWTNYDFTQWYDVVTFTIYMLISHGCSIDMHWLPWIQKCMASNIKPNLKYGCSWFSRRIQTQAWSFSIVCNLLDKGLFASKLRIQLHDFVDKNLKPFNRVFLVHSCMYIFIYQELAITVTRCVHITNAIKKHSNKSA